MWITFILARLIATLLLFWALTPNPPGYYLLLRIAIATTCVMGVYCANRWNLHRWIFAFGWLAVLFNPVYQVNLAGSAWSVIDIIIAAFMIASLFFVKPNREALSSPTHQAPGKMPSL